jgi:dolichol-phosphate mannosyltransferase
VTFLGGVQLVSVGIIGAYIGRIFEESKRRPLYVVRERIGFEGEKRNEDQLLREAARPAPSPW